MASEYILPCRVDRSHPLRQPLVRNPSIPAEWLDRLRRVISPCGAPVFQSDDRARPGHPAELERRRAATPGAHAPCQLLRPGRPGQRVHQIRQTLSAESPEVAAHFEAAGIQSHVSTTHDIMESQADITTLLGWAVIGSGRIPVSGYRSIPETMARMCSGGPIVDGDGPHRTQGGVVAQPRRLASHKYQETAPHSSRTSSYGDRWRSSG